MLPHLLLCSGYLFTSLRRSHVPDRQQQQQQQRKTAATQRYSTQAE
jgi:hypothetical protein